MLRKESDRGRGAGPALWPSLVDGFAYGIRLPVSGMHQITLFGRDEPFNLKALKALGVDPAVARELGYPLKDSEELEANLGFLGHFRPS